MKLKNLGTNKTQVSFPDGSVVFFSYETPVAAQQSDGTYVRTSTKYSVTTSKHITQWLEGVRAEEVPQAQIDGLTTAADDHAARSMEMAAEIEAVGGEA